MAEEIAGLVARPNRLCCAHWAKAMRTAREIGRSLADQLLPSVAGAIRPGRQVLPNPYGYLALLIRPLWEEGAVSDEDLARWEAGFANGSVLRDPRVQAFSVGCAERACEIASDVNRTLALLSRYLEAPPEEIFFGAIGPHGRPIFGFGDERFLALTHVPLDPKKWRMYLTFSTLKARVPTPSSGAARWRITT